MEIFLSRNGQQFGPYTAEWLESFVAEGTVSAEDLAWMPGRTEWVPLRVLLAELKPPPAAEPVEASPPPSAEERPSQEEPPALGLDPEVAATVRARPGLDLGLTLRGVAAVLAGILLIAGLTMLASVPRHASIRRNGEHWLLPEDGYTFVDESDPFTWKVQWTPGKPSATKASLLAASEEGQWVLAPGYEYRDAGADPIWRPGKREAVYPHAIADETAGSWLTDPGYVLAGDATPSTPRTIWRQGVRLPHMESAEQENYWDLDPGYQLVDRSSEHPRAGWVPGTRHSQVAHVSASDQEGVWLADSGYSWLEPNVPNDLRTFHVAQTLNAWSRASAIDAATNGIDCSDAALLAVLETARDRYAALDVQEVHPVLTQHFKTVRETLDGGVTMMNACFVVTNAGDAVDFAAGALCFGSALFSDENFDECMKKSETTRKWIGAGSQVGGVACDKAAANFWKDLGQLERERVRLKGEFLSGYGLQLADAYQIITCR